MTIVPSKRPARLTVHTAQSNNTRQSCSKPSLPAGQKNLCEDYVITELVQQRPVLFRKMAVILIVSIRPLCRLGTWS